MMDQLSAKWLEAAEKENICTIPNFKALKEKGVHFNQAFSSNPLCCPARATLATGLSSRQHGVLQNGYSLNKEIPTMMGVLQDNGWRTGLFGKLHLHPHYAGLYPDYKSYGFDVTYITEDPRGGEWLDWVKKEYPEHFEDALATIWPDHIPEFKTYGSDKENLQKKIKEIRKEYDWSSQVVPDGDSGHYSHPFPEKVSQTNWITENALNYIRETDPDTQIFAQISYVQPHAPYNAPEECFYNVKEKNIPEPITPAWPEDPLHPVGWDEGFYRIRKHIPENWREIRKCYFADLIHLDRQLGKVIKELEETGRLENTYIFLLSDHGDMLFDHGCKGKGEIHYDACIRIPLIISGPGIKEGVTSKAFVQLEDICPTVMDIAGIDFPVPQKMGPYLREEKEIESLPGYSLLPILRGNKVSNRKYAYVESYSMTTNVKPYWWARTIRNQKYRYTYFPCDGGEQLFDLEDDPQEINNLANDSEYDDIHKELKDNLLDEIILQDYPHPPRDLFAHGVH